MDQGKLGYEYELPKISPDLKILSSPNRVYAGLGTFTQRNNAANDLPASENRMSGY